MEVGASTRAQTRDGLRHAFVKDLNRISATFPFLRWVLWVVTLTIRTVVCPVRGGFGYRRVTEIQCYLGSWRLRLLHSALVPVLFVRCFLRLSGSVRVLVHSFEVVHSVVHCGLH